MANSPHTLFGNLNRGKLEKRIQGTQRDNRILPQVVQDWESRNELIINNKFTFINPHFVIINQKFTIINQGSSTMNKANRGRLVEVDDPDKVQDGDKWKTVPRKRKGRFQVWGYKTLKDKVSGAMMMFSVGFVEVTDGNSKGRVKGFFPEKIRFLDTDEMYKEGPSSRLERPPPTKIPGTGENFSKSGVPQ